MFVAIVVLPLMTFVLWLFSIRPYCRRNGKGFTPGATIWVTYWVDWQEAKEMSKARGDTGMIMICHLVSAFHIACLAILAYAIFKPDR